MAPNGPAEPPGADPADRAGLHAPVHVPGTTLSILVVDDDPDVLDLVSRVLRRAGAEVTAERTGRAAIRAIADGRCRPAFLVTDIDMPGMTGIELSARVTALRPGVRIVMMTGDPNSAEEARNRPDLVTRVLLKPVTVDELLAAVGLAGAHRERR